MKSRHLGTRPRALHGPAFGLMAIATLLQGSMAAAEMVVEWNEIAVGATATAAQGPVPQSRTMAIVQASVHDAVNAITHEYKAYAVRLVPPAGASPEAAAVAAAHYALVQLFPAQAGSLDASYADSLLAQGLSISDPGIGVGESVARQILALRAGDGASTAQFPYTAPGAGEPGVWVPTPPALAPAVLPGWGSVTPWVLTRGSQFRPSNGPPALTGRRYAADLNEVKQVGALNSTVRTADQTNLAKFWVASAAVIWNGILRQVATARGLSLSDNARAFALLNIAGADAAIACWDTKYSFNFWRPITAVRGADGDGNDDTIGDADWVPLITTPAFPEFLSGHSTLSAAMASVLGSVFGDDPGVPIMATSPTNPGFVREWTRFSQGVAEVVDARVFSGIHFRTSDVRGAVMGARVAHVVVRHALKPERRHHGEE